MANNGVVFALAALVGPCLLFEQARAQDVLGAIVEPFQKLWSGKSENAVAYEVSFSVPGGKEDLVDVLQDASGLAANSDQGASSAETLLAWAREEPARLTAALYSQGYYSGRIEVRVAGQRVDDASAVIALPAEGPAPIAIQVEPGPLFQFGDIRISYRDGGQPSNGDANLAGTAGLTSGAPARSTAVLNATSQIVTYWKNRGHAFAKVVSRDVTADHATRKVHVAFVIDPGRPARFGEVEIRGAERFEVELLRSRADIPAGETYSPETMKAARKRLAKLDGVRGVRIIEGDAPDSEGRIPIILEVTERKARYIGASAAISSVDGAEIGAHWGHRNVLGTGESLRVEATVSNLGNNALKDLEYETKISLTRPSIASAYTDYKTSFAVKHEEPDSYESDAASLSFGATHQFSAELAGELALKGSWIETEDAFGESEFVLLSLPGELIYDTRDNPLDPSEGWRAAMFAEPAVDLQNSTSFVQTRAQLSGYIEIAKTPRVIAAGRIGVGTIAGADIEDVPATARFLAGGGGSVRGYAYRSVGPEFANEIVGGLSIVEGSAELRVKVTETIGLVPFIDAAFVTSDSFFGGDGEPAVGVGLGLRYHTAIGPIRFDVATPLNKLKGEPEVVFYVGLGQAF